MVNDYSRKTASSQTGLEALAPAGGFIYSGTMSQSRRVLTLVAFPLFIISTIVLVWVFRAQFASILRDRDILRAWILDRQGLGVAVFVGLQALQVVLFVLPGEVVQVAGGYIFGLWWGAFLSLLGITLGSIINFAAGRLLGRPFITALFGAEKTEKLERLSTSPKAAAGFFIFFIVPGIPKDALCYVAGMSRLGLLSFLAISSLGRLPGIAGSTFMGSESQQGSWLPALIVLGLATLLFVLGLVFKERLEAFVDRLTHR